MKALFDMGISANRIEPGHSPKDNRNDIYADDHNRIRNNESSFFNMIQDNLQKQETPEPKQKETRVDQEEKPLEKKLSEHKYEKEEENKQDMKTGQFNDLFKSIGNDKQDIQSKQKQDLNVQQSANKQTEQTHQANNLKNTNDKVEPDLKNIGSLIAKELGVKPDSNKVVENNPEKVIHITPENKQKAAIKNLADFIKSAEKNDLPTNKQADYKKANVQTQHHTEKFEPNIKEKVLIEEAIQKQQTIKNKKTNTAQVQNTNRDNVSRETPKTTNVPIQENTLPKDQKLTDDLSNKVFTKERTSLSEGLKKTMDSDMSSFQGFENGSRSGSDKTGFLSKLDGNPALRSSIQQQVDAILSRARTIIRSNGNASFSTNLYPREFGKISIKLSLVDGKLKGNFTVENEAVQKELIQKMDKIVSDMKLDGYEVEEFNVNVNSGEAERQAFEERENNAFNKSMNKKAEFDESSKSLKTEQKKNKGIYA
ncbi:MAG: flagellar hook-length control protein FliK [Leptospirales bacterium]